MDVCLFYIRQTNLFFDVISTRGGTGAKKEKGSRVKQLPQMLLFLILKCEISNSYMLKLRKHLDIGNNYI